MGRTMLRLGIETVIGIGLSTVIFFTVIWLGYSDAQTTGDPITFANIEIFRVTNENEIANNENMTWIGIVITGACIALVETYRSLRKNRYTKTAA
ncbi:hypothetical protein L479_00208 [Exiguobacterium sp. S17]|nr:hypothetical protein L479_00208 [Exiguobacterium sp. S17]